LVRKALENSIKHHRKLRNMRGEVKVIAPLERLFCEWVGGSILASLRNYDGMRFTRQDYEEYGPSHAYRISSFGFSDMHESNFDRFDIELEGRLFAPAHLPDPPVQPPEPGTRTPGDLRCHHHYSFDPLWSQQVLRPDVSEEVRFDAEACAALFTLERPVGSWTEHIVSQVRVGAPQEEEEEVGEALTVHLSWTDAGAEPTALRVCSTDDVWASVFSQQAGLVDGTGLQLWWGEEEFAKGTGSYGEYGIEEGARLTASYTQTERIVAMSTAGGHTSLEIPENASRNWKRMQLVMVGCGNGVGGAVDSVAEYRAQRQN